MLMFQMQNAASARRTPGLESREELHIIVIDSEFHRWQFSDVA